MIQLDTGEKLSGKAGTASAVNYRVSPDLITTGDDFSPSNGQLTTSTATMFDSVGGQTLIKSLQGTNITASPVSGIILYAGGTTSGHIIVELSLVAKGSFTYEDGEGWQTYDSTGASLGGAGIVTSVVAGNNIDVDNTDPFNPIISVENLVLADITDVTASAAEVNVLDGITSTTAELNYTDGVTSPIQTQIDNKQPLDSDLTTIAGLTATTDNFLQSKSSAWASRTVAQVKTDLGLTGTNSGDQTITLTSDVTGSGTGSFPTTIKTDVALAGNPTTTTQSANNNSTRIATTAYVDTGDGTRVPNTRTLTTTTPIRIDGGASADLSANRTLSITAASGSAAGSLSATNYNNVNNYFGQGFYNVLDYGVSPANTASQNVTAMNTLLQTTALDNSEIYFPPVGLYQFNAGLTTLTKDFLFTGVRGHSQIAFTANFSGNFITAQTTGFYTGISGLSFINFVTQTAGAVFAGLNNSTPLIEDCFFTGGASSSLFNILDFTGTSSGVGAVIRNMYANGWSNIAVNIASPLDTIYFTDMLLLGTAGALVAAVGIECTDGGALELTSCQIIACGKLINLAPPNTKTVSAVFGVNCFFDQGTINALRITGSGTGTVARCHFIGCWFTVAGSGSNLKCIQIDSSGSGIHAGIQFQCCEIMNATAGSTGTIHGIIATAVQDICVSNCQMAGWTTDVELTPASNGSLQPQLVGNDFSNWGLITGSANNVIFNVGSFTYGQVSIVGNVFGGTTSKLQDNSTLAAGADKLVIGNTGLTGVGAVGALAAGITTLSTAAQKVTGTTLSLPVNGLRVGSRIRFEVFVCKTAGTTTNVMQVKFGSTGTPASDTTIASFTSGTNTALVDTARYVVEVQVLTLGSGTSATVSSFVSGTHAVNTAATGLGGMPTTSLAGGVGTNSGFNSTAATPQIYIAFTGGTGIAGFASGIVQVMA